MERRLYYEDETVGRICGLDRIIIYGAGIMGRALKLCLESDVYGKKVEYFVVMNEEGNPHDIDGCPVIGIDKAVNDKDSIIIVALNEKNLNTAVPVLTKHGFKNLIVLNAAGDSWTYIKGNYLLSDKTEKYLPFLPINRVADNANQIDFLKIYVAKSIYDKENNRTDVLNPYEVNIQVGASLTDKAICKVRDDVGDNISSKNRQYCELTALYWIWRNVDSEYIGLSHYRRRFDIDECEIKWMAENGVDAVVTIPVINTRGIGEQYGLDHSAEDWIILKEELHRFCPEYDDSFDYVQCQIYFYPCNMFIMKKEMLNEYCEWLFPILFACESRIGTKDDIYQNRYAGFLAERLLSVFLYHNKNKYRVCVAKREYLGGE